MNLKQLNRILKKTLREDSSQANLIEDIKNGTSQEKNIGDIVLENLDEVSVDDLVNILENYKWYSNNGVHKLFPSGFYWMKRRDESPVSAYPAKLAEAVAKSAESETISDIYNIFYRCHGDLQTWGEAEKVWEEQMMNPNAMIDFLSMCDDEAYYNDIMSTLYDEIPEFAKRLEKKLLQYNKEKVQSFIDKRD